MDVTCRIPLKTIVLDETSSIGLHIKKKRLDLKLWQRDVALLFGVSEASIVLWETGDPMPHIKFAPKIIKFLGYNPYGLETETLSGKVKNFRFSQGLTPKQMGKMLGVDASTVRAWEANISLPQPANAILLDKLLSN